MLSILALCVTLNVLHKQLLTADLMVHRENNLSSTCSWGMNARILAIITIVGHSKTSIHSKWLAICSYVAENNYSGCLTQLTY